MSMKIAKINAGLTTKLSVVVTSVVILALVALGVYFDGFLQKSFFDNAQQRMEHGYKRLAYNLNNIETELRDGIVFIKTDEPMRASIDLINNYQDKSNYNTYLIDEEKKTIALMLLNQVKLSFNNTIALYDQNKEIIAYVSKDRIGGYLLQFLSFDGGKEQFYGRYEHDGDYVQTTFPQQSHVTLRHDGDAKGSRLRRQVLVTYHRMGDDIVLTSHLDIIDENTGREVAYIELSKVLDQAYFEIMSGDLDINLTHSFDEQYAAHAEPLGRGLNVGALNVVQSEHEFRAAMKRESENGVLYFVARLDKTNLNTILDENRTGFLFLLLAVAAITLLLMRYLIQRSLAMPLDVLMGQIHKIEHQDYSVSDRVSTGDEFQAISASVNQLAFAVREREASLRKSQNVLKREITEREQAESQILKLSQAVEQSSATVIITNTDGRIEYVNRKFVETTGYTFEEVFGKNPRILKSGHTPPEEYDTLWQTISSGREWRGEFHNKRKDGTLFWEAASISPIKAPDGTTVNYLSIKEDITERKETEQALILAKETAEFANHAKSNFLANMSHELRTPLNAIIGFSQMLKDQTFGPVGSGQNQEYVELINDSGEHLLDIISDILDLSKIEAGEESIEEENIILSMLTDECSAMLKDRAAQQKLSLKIDMAKQMPKLCADAIKIKQVLLNLMTNAVKFTPEHGTVTVIFAVNEMGAIEMKVADSGIGIPAEDIPKVTNPFEQLEEANLRSKEGTGLGLALSKRLAELHGGTLSIESEVDKGTTVTVTFPPERTVHTS